VRTFVCIAAVFLVEGLQFLASYCIDWLLLVLLEQGFDADGVFSIGGLSVLNSDIVLF
jgi:hypothetical protein